MLCITHINRHTQPIPDCTRANCQSGRHTHAQAQSTIPAYQTAPGQIAGQGDTHMHTHSQRSLPTGLHQGNHCYECLYIISRGAHKKLEKILRIKSNFSYLWRIKLKTSCQIVVKNGPGRRICSFAIGGSATRSLRWCNRPRFIIHTLSSTRQVSIFNYCLPIPLNIKR